MPDFVTVAKTSDVPDPGRVIVEVDDTLVVLIHAGGQYYAIDDLCPHMGASLGAGHCEDGTVTCPWHAWRFRVTDGTWCDNPRIKTDTFEVRIEGDEIQVQISD